MQIKGLIKVLQSYDPDTHIACIMFDTGDVLHHAAKKGISLTFKEAKQIIDDISASVNHHDGISWNTIDEKMRGKGK